jgi:hypothetical protein
MTRSIHTSLRVRKILVGKPLSNTPPLELGVGRNRKIL